MIRLPKSLFLQTNRCCAFRSLLASPAVGGGGAGGSGCICTRVCVCSCSGARFASNDRGEKFNPEDELKRSLAKKSVEEQTCEHQTPLSRTTPASSSSPTSASTATEPDDSGRLVKEEVPVLKNRAYIEINLFGPKDARTLLPGNVGPSPKKYDPRMMAADKRTPTEFRLITNHTKNQNAQTTTTIERQLYAYETTEDRQNRVLENVLYNYNADFDLGKQFSQIKLHLDVRVFECPELVSADLKKIFFAKSLEKLDILMITINRQSSVDEPADDDNCQVPPDLLDKTTELMEKLCEMLNTAGYWSDYIGPNEPGINFDLNYVSANSVETCQRYRSKSFQVQKLQDCKLIQYGAGGEDTFLGSIFTNAGLDAKPLKVILEKILNV